MSKGLCRWKVGLRGTHQTKQRKKENRKKKKSEEGGKLGENFHSFSREKECEMERESERKGEMGQGNGSGCVRLCLSPPSIIEV